MEVILYCNRAMMEIILELDHDGINFILQPGNDGNYTKIEKHNYTHGADEINIHISVIRIIRSETKIVETGTTTTRLTAL